MSASNKFQKKEFDRQRGTANQRGYGYKWQKARAGFLRSHPLCVKCELESRVRVATVVDHIKPHRNNMKLFWDRNNWQPLCDTCHNSYKKRLEQTGKISGCNNQGIPTDPNHHWNNGGGM